MKKVYVTILIYFIVSIVSCGPKEFTTRYVTIHSARALFFSFNENGIFPFLDEFNRNELGIGIYPDSISEIIEITELNSIGNYAYGDEPYEVIYENSIDSINIYTIYDFDDKHPANSNINDILKTLNSMGETNSISNMTKLSFTRQHFKFSEVPESDSMQFLITGRISEGNAFRITTQLVIL